jgi:hypothetical protein
VFIVEPIIVVAAQSHRNRQFRRFRDEHEARQQEERKP